MRLWSLHPRFLDRQGLTACWREALLAQAVLAGRTRGYRSHPQLVRFRDSGDPLGAIASYLDGIRLEAGSRGYRFDGTRILEVDRCANTLSVTEGQLRYELGHLVGKLKVRSPGWAASVAALPIEAHPLFRVVPGPIEGWERL